VRQTLFAAATVLLVSGLLAGLLWLGRGVLLRELEPQLLSLVAASLTDEERAALVAAASEQVTGFWDATPEPLVGRLGRPGAQVRSKGAEVEINGAGLRSRREFERKPPGIYRVVCLGDSFVFGVAGREQDRYCDQLEAFYAEHDVRVEGARIEAWAVGLGSWTAVQSATYLSTRISDYEPDLVLVLTVPNDVTDASGVTGIGTVTSRFAPDRRALGSAVFSNRAGAAFGDATLSALTSDLVPEAVRYWGRAMAALRRLTELQQQRGGRILHGVLDFSSPYFVEAYKRFYHEARIAAPAIVTNYSFGPETRLPHDAHPSRIGHGHLMAHYVHVLDALGWIEVPEDVRPPLHPRLSLDTRLPVDHAALAARRREFMEDFVRAELDFASLRPSDTVAFLGGILPERFGPHALDAPPWGSVRSGFVLRAPEGPATLVLEVRIPPRVELYPLTLRASIDGRAPRVFEWSEPPRTAVQTLRVPVAADPSTSPVLEVMLEADRYFTMMLDGRMRSFQLLRASFEEAP